MPEPWIIEVEERFCKVAKIFSKMLHKVQRAAERGDAVHEVEEMTFGDLIETGRETIVAFIKEQKEELPRPEVIEHEGKLLRRLPERRVRPYVSAFGPMPFARDVYATRETQRQEVVPLDAKLGMPESDTSYLLQRWSGAQFVKGSYSESRTSLQSILGFAPSVNCLEDMAAQASAHADVYFDEQSPVDPTTEAEILVATSDCKGVPMRKVDAPRTKHRDDAPRRKRLKKGEKNGQKRMACVGGVYSVVPFCRTADYVLNEILHKERQEQRPEPQNKRLRAVLTRQVDDKASGPRHCGTVLEKLNEYGFVPGNYTKVIVSWGWTDDVPAAAKASGVELWSFQEILQEIAETCRSDRTYFTDDTMRTLQLMAKVAPRGSSV